VDAHAYLGLAKETHHTDEHELHELDLIKALLETRISKFNNELFLFVKEENGDKPFEYEESVVTVRTINRCSLAGISEGTLNLHELELLLLQASQDEPHSPMGYLTIEQSETIK
jgi:hypothetical protein